MYSVLQLSQLIRNVWICGRIDSSSIIAHPIYTTGTIAKIRCQEVDISIIDRYNSFDNRYGFIVSNGNTTYHIFLLNQVEGAIAIPPSNSAPLALFCPSVCPSVCPSIGLLTTFSGFCTFADKSLGRNGIELEMQLFPDDLPLANIDADGYCCHFMRSSVRPTIHGLGFVYCIQSAWKKWPTIWHAMYPDGLHSAFMDAYGYCCWSVCPSICPFVRLRHFQVAVHLLTNHLEQMA